MLDWNRFQNLPGAVNDNFEKLCRGVVRRHFGRLGPLRALKNQPGVEFYITLNEDHPSLAKKNDTVGWQNKWFDYKANGELTSSEKNQILHSLDKTKEHVSQINHWYLWTHKTLANCDQDWYFGLQGNYRFTLHLWNQNDLEGFLSGPALDLRNTYFGELALTHEMLLEQHEKSIAPIKSRWLHEVHQQMDAELQVRKVLGEKEAWNIFESIADSLNEVSELIDASIKKPECHRWNNELETFHNDCKIILKCCELFNKDICGDDIEGIKTTLEEIDANSKDKIHKTLMQLRTNNLPLSLTITNALAYIKDAKNLFHSAIDLLSQQSIAILADAGGGKTQLSAELTAQSSDRSAGILILGRSFKKGMNIDDIAKDFTFYQKQVDNFEALISAVNSVGERSGRRLPIVIDGLNEAQDPREWKPLLESVLPILKKYPNVVIVCTLRTSENRHRRHAGRESIAQQSLPESMFQILSEGYGEELTSGAIKSYFKHYKIIADPYTAPLKFFSHPLNLKIFCEVTNRKAETEMQVSYFPSSIYSLFGKQIDHVACSIANMTNLVRIFTTEDIKKAIYYLGECLWEENSRSLKEDVFRKKMNFPLGDWNSDIVNLLAQEGIIFRNEGDITFTYKLTPIYDRLGGFIVAEHLLSKYSQKPLTEWVTENVFIKKLFGEMPDQHPLSQDILYALVVLTPKTIFGQQFWKSLPEDFQSSVLAMSYLIDKDDLCSETIDGYKSLIINGDLSNKDIEQLLTLMYTAEHPFNALFLNEVLLTQSVTDRDMSWTEYLRSHRSEIINELKTNLKNIKSGNDRYDMSPEIVRLRMIFYAWHLTSTVIDLRGYATELLYQLGQKDPSSMFELTIDLLNVNDPYVSERLLASSYAVATTLIEIPEHKFSVIDFARKLYKKIFICGATNSTTHILARDYASCTLKLVDFHFHDDVKDLHSSSFTHPFPSMPRVKWGCVKKEEEEYSCSNSPFRMDFENYIIGTLIKDRRNYDYSHEGYKVARCNILWRINELGWSHDQFEKIEQSIESETDHCSPVNRSKVERYGKKYSWIAYYELAGQLSDEDKLEYWGEQRFTTDIDPFFPDNAEHSDLGLHAFLSDNSTNTQNWVYEAELPDLSGIFEVDENGQDWILLDGSISEESERLDRNFFCSVNTAFISSEDSGFLQKHISDEKKIDWPKKHNTCNIYSGELYCEALRKLPCESAIRVETGYETQTYERPEIRINEGIYIKGEICQNEVPIFHDLKILSTIINYYWENLNGSRENVSRLALAPWVVKKLGLQFNPSTFTYLDNDGNNGVLNVNAKGDTYSNYRNLIYVRKDLFELLINRCGMIFIKRIFGHKRCSKIESRRGQDLYRHFETII